MHVIPICHIMPTLQLSFYLLPYYCMLLCIILSSISHALDTQYIYSVTIIFKHSFCNDSLHSGSPQDVLHLTSILYRGTFHVRTAFQKRCAAALSTTFYSVKSSQMTCMYTCSAQANCIDHCGVNKSIITPAILINLIC